MHRSQQMGQHERPEGSFSYNRHVREWIVRLGLVRLSVGFYRYSVEHDRPSRRRELNMSVSWMGTPLPTQDFPVSAPRNGGHEHA